VSLDARFGLEMTEWTPIGGGISIKPMQGYGRDDVVCFGIRHAVPIDPLAVEPGVCEGSVTIAEGYGGKPWTVVQERPLTLSPSIRCVVPTHEMHGFIRDGVWIPA
jgi:hypothetical protein